MSFHGFFALALVAAFLTSGQKPIKCKHENPQAGPSYRVDGTTTTWKVLKLCFLPLAFVIEVSLKMK